MIINDRVSFDPVLIVTNGLLVHLILKNKLNYRIHYVFFLCLCLFFIGQISRGVYPGQLFLGGSRNTVTIVLFMNIALLHFIEYINENHISLFPVIPFVYISIVVMGRTGIICSLIYIFYILYYITKKISLRILIIMVLLLYTIIFYDKIELIFITYFNNIINKGINYTEDPRMDMLTRYLENIDLITFFIGYDIRIDTLFRTYNGNPHNSFINLHTRIGILSLPFVLLIIFKLLKFIRTNFFFVVLLSLILIRAWIDTMFFFNVYDFIIYSILIYKSSPRIFHENNQSR
jgi:ABC-type multidrug transport system fused ATPase/permease subunit